MVMGSFHCGHYIAQRLCPDNIHLLAWRQTGINSLVASLLLLQLFRCLDFPRNANVGNLRRCPGTMFLSCCPCCLLGKSSSGRTRHSRGLLSPFHVNADSFHRKLSNRDTKSCSSSATGMSWVQLCHGSMSIAMAIPPLLMFHVVIHCSSPEPQHKSLGTAKVTNRGKKTPKVKILPYFKINVCISHGV